MPDVSYTTKVVRQSDGAEIHVEVIFSDAGRAEVRVSSQSHVADKEVAIIAAMIASRLVVDQGLGVPTVRCYVTSVQDLDSKSAD
jgi:hypothetical protein